MSIQLRKLDDSVKNQGLKCLVFGPSGAGKTRLCGTCDGKTLIISAEAGLLSLAGHSSDITVAEVNSIDDIHEVYQMLSEKQLFDWVCLDSLSEIGEVVLTGEKAIAKDARMAYMEMADRMAGLVRAFRDLPGYNILMTAKQERIKDDSTGALLYAPSMPGSKFAQSLPYFFDFVFAYRVEKNDEGEIVRVLQTARDVTHEAKDRSGKLEMYEKPDMAAIRKKVASSTK